MWYIKFSWTVLVFAVLFSVVTGSCLEYGHSCWGAHGKRSGNRAVVDTAGAAGAVAAKQPQPAAFADNLAEQFFNRHSNSNMNNNNNNVNAIDDDSASSSNNNNNNNNRNYDLPQAAAALAAARSSAEATSDNGKWVQQLLRQHRQQQLRQLQLQRQFDAVDAAESWRRLQLALAEAEQRQRLQEEQQQQQQAMSIGDFFELNK